MNRSDKAGANNAGAKVVERSHAAPVKREECNGQRVKSPLLIFSRRYARPASVLGVRRFSAAFACLLAFSYLKHPFSPRSGPT
ncbi:hypothetical protein [Prosthecobacter sp.]|uniref:hypothetical protein n=1 Tax=Prosthecobacter sp. TaxID=1965333 RepID=UPI0037837E71